jgi:cystathionine gamma-synthase
MSLGIYKLSRENGIEVIDLDADYQEGDICWLETPLNPTGEAR